MIPALTSRAIGWIDAQRREFTIANEQSHPFYSIKPVAELGEAAALLLTTQYADTGKQWLEHAWAQLRRGELIKLLLRGPETLVQAAIYNPFYRAGLRDAGLEEAIASRAGQASLVPPLHRLPVSVTLGMLGLPAPWTLDQIVADEWTTRMGSPFSLSATDLYMATHIAFYATQYGRNRAGLGEAQREYLNQWIPVWIDDLSVHGQLDLIAELVIAYHCVSETCSDEKAWKLFERNQRSDGSIPYQVTDQRQVGVPGMTPQREQFLRDYHSTLVTAMAGALCAHDPAAS